MRTSLQKILVLIAVLVCNSTIVAAEDDLQKQILRQLLLLQTDLNLIKRNMSALHERIDTISGDDAVTQPEFLDLPDKILLRDFSVLGSDTAKVAIIEFSDFQCPYCAGHAAEVLPEIRRNLVETGLVKYDIQDFPLSIHPEAAGAAVAANCAGIQGKYWEMHDYLNAHFDSLGAKLYTAAADRLALDIEAFGSCRSDALQLETLKAGTSYAGSIGVSGTPGFFIGRVNGSEITDVVFVQGVRDFNYFSSVVNQLSETK